MKSAKFLKTLFVCIAFFSLLALCTSAQDVKPGINILTGTTQPLSFEDGVLPQEFFTKSDAMSVVDYPGSIGEGKALLYAGTGEYAFFPIKMPAGLSKDTALYISFKTYKEVKDGSSVETATSFWLMKDSVSAWQIAKSLPAYTAGVWHTHSYVVDTFGTLINSDGEPDLTDISNVVIEYDNKPGGKLNCYFDDIEIVPAYRITYLDDDSEEIAHEFMHFPENVKTFTPVVTDKQKQSTIIGWSTTKGGKAVTEVEVKNEHINLYAVYDNTTDIHPEVQKNLFIDKGQKATLSATLYKKGKATTEKAKYTLYEGNAVKVKDNNDGTATITSVSDGTAVVKVSAKDGSSKLVHFVVNTSYKAQGTLNQISCELGTRFAGNHRDSYYDQDNKYHVFINNINTTKTGDGYLMFPISDFSVAEYPYLNITYKCKVDAKFQLALSYDDEQTKNKVWKYPHYAKNPLVLSASEEFTTGTLDLTKTLPDYDKKQWSGVMIGSVVTDENIIVKEITFSNIPIQEPKVTEICVTQAPEKLVIDKEGMTLNLSATVISNRQAQDTSLVSWSLDDATLATLMTNADGSVTITPLKNGKVTVTATDLSNSLNTKDFVIEISNQRAKTTVYDFRILFWGASTFKHGSAPSIGWYYPWGMAATKEENDIVHKVMYYLRQKYNCDIEFVINSTSSYDSTISGDSDPNKDYSSDPNYRSLMADAKSLKPNIMVVCQMPNLSGDANIDCVVNAYGQAYEGIYEICPDIIIAAECCTINHQPIAEQAYELLVKRFEKQQLQYNDVAINRPDNYYPAPGTYAHSGVQNHPGDEGMDWGARGLVALIENAIQKITPEYVYLPEKIELRGENAITEAGGKIEFSVGVAPEDATADVNYEIDNTNIATIDKNGVLTAKYNGTVKVTAKSKYCDVKDEITVTITGQPDYYNVSYNAGTTDTVTNLPESVNYINGTYRVGKTVPVRELYDFVGWSLTEGGEVAQNFEINSDTTLYAVWKKTTGFEFDGEYSEDDAFTYGINVEGGFHNIITKGRIETMCSIGAPVTFVSPKLDISNRGEMVFALSGGYYKEGGTLEIKVNDKEYVVDIAKKGEMSEYKLDISDAGHKITGFEIFYNCIPGDKSMFTIAIDYIRFEGDKVIAETETETIPKVEENPQEQVKPEYNCPIEIVEFKDRKVTINAPAKENITLAVAAFKGQTLLDLEVQHFIKANAGINVYALTDIFNFSKADNLKVMIWENLEYGDPLSKAKVRLSVDVRVN